MEKKGFENKGVEINLPTEELKKLQEDLVSELSRIFPNLEIEAIGAAAVPIAGRNELDIMVISDSVFRDTEILAGNGYRKGPVENGISYLKIFRDGVEVGIQIIPTGHKMIDIHRQIIFKLRGDAGLRDEYEKFKLSLSGLGAEKYKQKKSKWLKNILLNSN